jgi:phosphatidylserine/phosphatidylglycerophosphate/cardiolipin synthase-like enzyme
MVQASRREILLVGYVFTEGARHLMEHLASAAHDRGVRITLIGNKMQGHLPALRSIWPASSPAPSIFSREADPEDSMTALHAKLLICDSTTALVTSANFSHHGLYENIEIGVKVHSDSVVRLVEFVQAMIVMQVVKPLDWPAGGRTC